MTRRDISINGRKVRYYERGDGPVVVLLHGAGASARLWRPLMTRLTPGFRVIAPDLPGFGGSDFDPGAVGRDGMSRFITGFMNALGIGKAAMVASSMGGRAACILAAGCPDVVSALVLISPSGLCMNGEPSISIDGLLAEVERGYRKNALTGVRASGEMEKALSTIRALFEGGGLSTDIGGELEGIAAPTLIIWGDKDEVIPPSYADAFKSAIPGSAAVSIGGAGHLPYAEMPEETATVILNFLESTGLYENKRPA